MLDPDFRSRVAFQKIMTVSMDEDGTVSINHEIINHGTQVREIAPWALTVMTQNGMTIVPNVPYAPHGPGHFLPVRSLILWSYTDMADPRLKFMKGYTTIKQDPNAEHPFKLGFNYTEGWVAYALEDNLFVKHLEYDPSQPYSDMGSSVEIFTNNAIMEIESLGALKKLQPSESVRHHEKWTLHKIQPVQADAERIEQVIEKLNFTVQK
jgi:hypothetical protein